MMSKNELINYFDYLNKHKIEIFNSFHKLKNDRELKLSILLDNENIDLFEELNIVIDKNILDTNKISEEIIEYSKLDDLDIIKNKIDSYSNHLSLLNSYLTYLQHKIKKIINT
jgi:hypothetical protein